MRTTLEAARLLVYNAARLKDQKTDFIQAAAMAKLFASRAAEKICSTAVDLFGGNGFVIEYPVEKYYRDAKIGQIYEGTTNMQLQTIAKMELSPR
jgi:alkylation response protein AidB-like acyl-CoA dehydrogenase